MNKSMDESEAEVEAEITGLVVRADGAVEEVTFGQPRLKELQAAVSGYIEGLTLTDDVMAYINEEGKLHGLPGNTHAMVVLASMDVRLHPGDYIAGDMVLVGRLNSRGQADGEDHDLPAALRAQLLAQLPEIPADFPPRRPDVQS